MEWGGDAREVMRARWGDQIEIGGRVEGWVMEEWLGTRIKCLGVCVTVQWLGMKGCRYG